MRRLVVVFGKKTHLWATNFRRFPQPLQVLIQCVAVIVLASLIASFAATFTDLGAAFAIFFNSVIQGYLISIYLNQRFRLKALEKAFADGAIKELIATMADGRSIWIRDPDGSRAFEATPPQEKGRKAYSTESH